MKGKILLAAALALTVSACEWRHNEGPAERAGRHVDRAADSVADSADRARANVENRIEHDDDAEDRRERYHD